MTQEITGVDLVAQIRGAVDRQATASNSETVQKAVIIHLKNKQKLSVNCCLYYKNQWLFNLLSAQLRLVIGRIRRINSIRLIRTHYKDIPNMALNTDASLDSLTYKKTQLIRQLRLLLPCENCRLRFNPFNNTKGKYRDYRDLECLFDE